MPNKDNISIKDVYTVVDRMENKFDKRFDRLMTSIEKNSKRITTTEYWMENVKGRIAIIVAVATLGINFGWEYLKSKFDK